MFVTVTSPPLPGFGALGVGGKKSNWSPPLGRRPCASPAFKGRAFGSNAAANWGFQYHDLITGDTPREVVTIYEIEADSREQIPHPEQRAETKNERVLGC